MTNTDLSVPIFISIWIVYYLLKKFIKDGNMLSYYVRFKKKIFFNCKDGERYEIEFVPKIGDIKINYVPFIGLTITKEFPKKRLVKNGRKMQIEEDDSIDFFSYKIMEVFNYGENRFQCTVEDFVTSDLRDVAVHCYQLEHNGWKSNYFILPDKIRDIIKTEIDYIKKNES